MAALAPAAAPVRWPLQYLATHGPRADPATALTWGLIALSVLVIVVIAAAVVVGVVARHAPGASPRAVPIGPDRGGLAWIGVGLPLTILALCVVLVWTLEVMAAVDSPARPPDLTLEVSGHEWWWQVRYLGVGGGFTTANEIHIPVGQPVMVKLVSADVIHAFWVPALTGKTQTIPGRTNVTWLEADQAGVYRGQCTQYCGAQHAHMAFLVIAQAPAAFEAWRAAQLAVPAPPATPPAVAGEGVFLAKCGGCHAVRGTSAHGDDGPDLTHLMSRRTIASATLANNPANLLGWISDPQSLKPEARMPPTFLGGPQLTQLRAYLASLR